MKAGIEFCHPQEGNKGSAMRISIQYQTDESPGFARFSLANQTADGYDYVNGIVCDIQFDDLAKIVQVLRKECDAVGNFFLDGLCLHREPYLSVLRKRGTDSFIFRAKHNPRGGGSHEVAIELTPSESLGIRLALEHALFFLAFIKGVNP